MIRFRFIPILLGAVICQAQDLPPNTQQQIENIADASENENQEDDIFLQQLEYFRKHPLNLNTATAEELQTLRFLNDLQINNFVRYRSLLGNLIHIYELQAVPSWDLATIKKILPYIIIGDASTTKENFAARFKGGDQSLLFRVTRVLEKPKGYNTAQPTHYLGDRNHLMVRYRYQYKDLLYFGLTADKDAGEQFFKGAQSRGFDFYSFHFFARRLKSIKSLAIGDYTVNLGQGLIQWQSLGFGKSSEVMAIKRQSPVLVPYRSAGEFYFKRGAGITVQKGKFEATAFASHKKISGNVANDTLRRITSLLTSGYYRTSSEIADRNKITLTSFGGNISWQTGVLKIGLNTVAHQFSVPIQKRDEPYNYYAIAGRSLFNSSIDYSYTYKNVHLFGEAAFDKKMHRAFVHGALMSVDPKIDLSFLYRNIQKEYQSFFGNAFTENTLPANEKGLYAGIAVRPVNQWQLNAYADFFQFPWVKYRVDAPTKGFDYLLQLNYHAGKQFEAYVRYRNRNKPLNSSGNGVFSFPEDQVRKNFRMHFAHQLSAAMYMRSRVELIWFGHNTDMEEGFLGYAEMGYVKPKFEANARLQYFETDSYDSRIYAYEADVLYSFSIPAFYDKGFRYYLNWHYEFNRKIELWLRWAQTLYIDKTQVGSGLDELNGNKKTEVKLQLRYLLNR